MVWHLLSVYSYLWLALAPVIVWCLLWPLIRVCLKIIVNDESDDNNYTQRDVDQAAVGMALTILAGCFIVLDFLSRIWEPLGLIGLAIVAVHYSPCIFNPDKVRPKITRG